MGVNILHSRALRPYTAAGRKDVFFQVLSAVAAITQSSPVRRSRPKLRRRKVGAGDQLGVEQNHKQVRGKLLSFLSTTGEHACVTSYKGLYCKFVAAPRPQLAIFVRPHGVSVNGLLHDGSQN